MSSVRPTLSPDTPKVVTAWDARSGRTVYRTAAGDWAETLETAAVVSGDEAIAALAAAQADEARVTDPYVMEVAADGAIAGRETVRERIRASGPTTRLDHGKQADNP